MASLRLPAAGGGPKGGLGAIYLRVTTWDRVEWSAGGRLRERVLRAREVPAFFAEKIEQGKGAQIRLGGPLRLFAGLLSCLVGLWWPGGVAGPNCGGWRLMTIFFIVAYEGSSFDVGMLLFRDGLVLFW